MYGITQCASELQDCLKLFMNPTGTIYTSDKSPQGEARIALPWKKRLVFHLLNILGTAMVVVAASGFIFAFGPVVAEELSYRLGKKELGTQFGLLVDLAKSEREQKVFVESKAKELGAPNTNFSVVVPKIDARSRVLANVSAADAQEYNAALSQGVAHAAGTVFPGMVGTTFLFAHSTDAPLNISRFNAVFYLLRELEAGDNIFVFFSDKFYPYQVVETKIVEASDVSWITKAREGEERLILQTCWPPGTTLKRLLVVAKPVTS